MTSGVTAGFDVISFQNMRLQTVYCIPVTRLLLGYSLMSQGQRSKATSRRICHHLTGHLLLSIVQLNSSKEPFQMV